MVVKKQNRNVILSSGGLDSYLCWYLFCQDAVNVFIKINHPYQKKELNVVNQLQKKIKNFKLIIHDGSNIGQFEDNLSGIIPNRNAEFILSSAQYGENIFIGVIKNEINSDKSPEFFKSIIDVLNISNKKQYWSEGNKYKICIPTKKYTKSQLIKLYLEKGGSLELLDLTVSCYNKKYKQCGKCPSCFKRWVAYTNNGLIFKSKYNVVKWAKENGIIEKCKNGAYNKSRASEILLTLKKSGIDIE